MANQALIVVTIPSVPDRLGNTNLNRVGPISVILHYFFTGSGWTFHYEGTPGGNFILKAVRDDAPPARLLLPMISSTPRPLALIPSSNVGRYKRLFPVPPKGPLWTRPGLEDSVPHPTMTAERLQWWRPHLRQI